MTPVYSAPALPTVAWLRDVLKDRGIRCVIRNEFLSAGAGELPPNETWPTLCVLDRHQLPFAQAIIAEFESESSYANAPDWLCSHCGASNEAIFSACWQCATPDTRLA